MSIPAPVKTQFPTFLVMSIPTSLKITLPALLVTPLFPALYMPKSLTSLETLSLNIQPFLLSLRDHSLLSSI